MGICATCRTLLRRRIDGLQKLRQRRPISTHSELSKTKPGQAARPQEQVPTPNNVPTLSFWLRLGPLTRGAQAYARAQRKRPYVTQVCTSLFIYLCSDSMSASCPLCLPSGLSPADWCSLGAKYGRAGLRPGADGAVAGDRGDLVDSEFQMVRRRGSVSRLGKQGTD
jgi:hypothetical protein